MKNNKKLIIGFILGSLIFSVVGVCAATLLNGNEVTYDNTNSKLESTNVQDAIDELYEKTETIDFKIGDYVKMIPVKSSVSIPMTLTGWTVDQPLIPNELNLWRVIKINTDGTVEMISEYISSYRIHFKGSIGFQNYIGTLNYIAKQYENSKYTSGSRYLGYDGQIEFLTDTTKIASTTAPWTYSTKDNSNESLGGGDVLYSNDIELVENALSTLTAYTVNTTTADPYWLGSRHYLYMTETGYVGFFGYGGRIVENGAVTSNARLWWSNNSPLAEMAYANRIRPIVTLKSNISNISGNGTSESPYILN